LPYTFAYRFGTILFRESVPDFALGSVCSARQGSDQLEKLRRLSPEQSIRNEAVDHARCI
jgi:hypothetical protein